MKKLSLMLVLALAGTTACKKDDKKPAGESAQAGETKAPEAAKPTEAQPAAPAAGGAVTIADAADYEAKGLALVDAMGDAFASAEGDCDKAAANIEKFITENAPVFEAIKKFDEANPDAKKAMEEKAKAKGEELMGKILPIATKCAEHEGLKAAMEKMPQ